MERPSGPTRDYSDLIRRKCAWQASVPPAAAAEDPVVQSVIAAAPIAMGQTEAGPQTAVLEMGLPDPEARPAGHPLELLVDPLGGDKPGGAASQDMGAEECVAPRIIKEQSVRKKKKLMRPKKKAPGTLRVSSIFRRGRANVAVPNFPVSFNFIGCPEGTMLVAALREINRFASP